MHYWRESITSGTLRLTLVVFAGFAAWGCNDKPMATEAAVFPSESRAAVSGNRHDIAAMEAIVQSLDANWAVDAAAYAANFAGAEWVSPFGLILTDPAAITQVYTTLFQNVAGTVRHSTIRNLTFFTGTIAVLDIIASGPIPTCALEKNILIKRGGEWRIVQHQQVVVADGVAAGPNNPCPPLP